MLRADQHDEIELNYLLEGSLTYLMGGRRVQVPAQRLAVFWATVPHQIVAHEGGASYFVATIPFSWFLKWGMPSYFYLQIVQWQMVIDRATTQPTQDRIMFEQWTRDVGDQALAPAVALEMQARLLRLARYMDSTTPAVEMCHTSYPVASQDKAEQMACHVSSCYLQRLTIPKIAATVGLHPDYAATLFKRKYGTTIVNFITRHRVGHAQRLLLTTNDQMIRIASDSGFDSLSRFNRAFKEFTGLTPREYRRATQKPQLSM